MSFRYKDPEYNLITLNHYSRTETILLGWREIPSGRVIPMHWHDYIELEIVTAGEIEHIVNNTSTVVSRGSAYIMTSCDFHMLTAKSEAKLLNLSIMRGKLDPQLENYLESGVGKFNCTFSDEQLNSLVELFERGIRESGTEPFSALMKKNIAEELIITLIRACVLEDSMTVPHTVHKVINIVNDRFMNPLKLRGIADELFISPNYLGALFKSKVGVSFSRYLTMIRLRYACGLLDSTNKTITDVAIESGFASSEYFLAVFKKFMKCTPSEYRCQFHSDGVQK